MATITEVQASRDAAGAAYAAAAKAYVDAWVELHGHDMALSNQALALPRPLGFAAAPQPLSHGEYLREAIHGGLIEKAKARHDQIIKSLGV